MLIDWIDATSAACEVGYESVIRFRLDRFFGQPPMHDIKALRDGKAVAISARITLNCPVA